MKRSIITLAAMAVGLASIYGIIALDGEGDAGKRAVQLKASIIVPFE